MKSESENFTQREIHEELNQGRVSNSFYRLVDEAFSDLKIMLEDCELAIFHNFLAFPGNFCIQEALHKYCEIINDCTIINWAHDIWITSCLTYPVGEWETPPFNRIKHSFPNLYYITTTDRLKNIYIEKIGVKEEYIHTIHNAISEPDFLNISSDIQKIAYKMGLFVKNSIILVDDNVGTFQYDEEYVKVDINTLNDIQIDAVSYFADVYVYRDVPSLDILWCFDRNLICFDIDKMNSDYSLQEMLNCPTIRFYKEIRAGYCMSGQKHKLNRILNLILKNAKKCL